VIRAKDFGTKVRPQKAQDSDWTAELHYKTPRGGGETKPIWLEVDLKNYIVSLGRKLLSKRILPIFTIPVSRGGKPQIPWGKTTVEKVFANANNPR
jgi:hypothetical protein